MRAAWWWIDRWRKSTAYTDMTAEAQGVYRNLLDELWLRNGVIPCDQRILAKIGGDHAAWPRVRKIVLAHFVLTPEGYRNTTHDEVAAGTKRFLENQREKGKKRAASAIRSEGRFQPDHQPQTSRETSLPSPSLNSLSKSVSLASVQRRLAKGRRGSRPPIDPNDNGAAERLNGNGSLTAPSTATTPTAPTTTAKKEPHVGPLRPDHRD